MTIGNLAAIIAAVSFAVLVVFLCLSFSKVMGILDKLQQTVAKLNDTIDVVTKDVDALSSEVETLLNKSNSLVDDINQKLVKTDPLFQAIGDVGVSVSELNHSTKEMTSHLVSGIVKKRLSPMQRIARTASKIGAKRSGEKVTVDSKEVVAEPQNITIN